MKLLSPTKISKLDNWRISLNKAKVLKKQFQTDLETWIINLGVAKTPFRTILCKTKIFVIKNNIKGSESKIKAAEDKIIQYENS